jgi:hypothetical protein
MWLVPRVRFLDALRNLPHETRFLGALGAQAWGNLTGAAASAATSLRSFDDYDTRGLIKNCYNKAYKRQWNLSPPRSKTKRAYPVHPAHLRTGDRVSAAM